MGVNVESDLESALILHTFALSKIKRQKHSINNLNNKRYDKNVFRPRGNGDDDNECKRSEY